MFLLDEVDVSLVDKVNSALEANFCSNAVHIVLSTELFKSQVIPGQILSTIEIQVMKGN